MIERFDVAIIGGGPAGSTCAWRLKQAGVNVVVFDQKTFPRDKTCAGWVTPAVFDTLQIDQDDYEQGRVLQPITGFRTGVIGGKEIETRYDHAVSYGIRRREFDTYLLNRSGTEMRTGQSVRSLTRLEECWRINETCEARVLVGAGGHFCPVARMLGAREVPHTSVVTAQEIELEVTPEDLTRGTIDAETPELFFCEDLAGYGWCFRKESYLNIGLGRVEANHLTDHVQSFVQFLRDRGKIVAPLPDRFHGHAYQLYEHVAPKLMGERVLLIGDAAGLAHPKSGEGIRPAVESALIAAQLIQEALTSGQMDSLSMYPELMESHFGTLRRFGSSDWLPHSWLGWMSRQLLKSRLFTQHVILDQWFLNQAG
jgi:geranylgeranyl reductase family protein